MALYLFSFGGMIFLLANDSDPGRALPFLVFGLALGIFGFARDFKVDSISKKMFAQDVLYDNQMTPVTTGLDDQAKSLAQSFGEFRRGDHKRGFKQVLQSHFSGEEHSFTYRYFHFHYVDKRNGSKGSTYYHYDRYGLLVQFDFAQSMAIQNYERQKNWGNKFKTASIRFNKIYKVDAASEMDAAKFLKPKVVVALEDIHHHFYKPNFEFSPTGELCMSFDDSDLILLQRKHGLNAPDQFIKELQKDNLPKQLQIALEHIHTLMKYSDSNF
ncbi:MAG: hypothetical protein KUG59_07955 [Parvibaculaceae bacterium]|nr:hypothetical protein [Parvibaculaceae bacterium]